MDANLIARVCETYAYHGQLGLQQFNLSHCAIVVDSANPNVWSSNKVYAVVASRPDEVELLFSELYEPFQHTDYHHFIIDPLTPAPFEAALVVREFVELEATLQMVRASPAKLAPRSDLEILPVQTHSDWDLLLQLVLADHAEGARTLGALSNTVSAGIVAGYRAKAPNCQFFWVTMTRERWPMDQARYATMAWAWLRTFLLWRLTGAEVSLQVLSSTVLPTVLNVERRIFF